MAVLTLDSLTGCSSIPSFMGGSVDTPSNPTKTIFHNTNAPTNWVKDTTHNDKALRVIGGASGTALSAGGLTSFSSIFTSGRGGSFATSSNPMGVSIQPSPFNYPSGPFPVTGTTGTSVLTLAQMAAHAHQHSYNIGPQSGNNNASPLITSGTTLSGNNTAGTLENTGTTGHNHSFDASHSHTIQDTGHTHTLTATGPHSHQATVSQDFSIQYIDVIIATKS